MLCPPGARWHPEEEKNDPEFAKQLAEGCDIYVNDAFGTAHRAHASTAGGLPCGVSLEARACTGQVPPNALECTGCATWCCPSGVPIHCCPMLLTCCPAASAAAGVASYLSPKVSGFLMKKELDYLGGWVGRLDCCLFCRARQGVGVAPWRQAGWGAAALTHSPCLTLLPPLLLQWAP